MVAVFVAVVALGGAARAQQPETNVSGAGAAREARVALAEPAVAFDAAGRAALSARLRTTQLAGTPDSPARNSRLVIENRGGVFYTHTSGYATFYGADGVRCGEGLWKVEALAPGESAEVDTPGLRLTCTPATWRVVAVNLLTRAADAATATPATLTTSTPAATANPADAAVASSPADAPAPSGVPPLEINVNGKTIPIQLGNPLEFTVGRERVRVVVRAAP
ncbi:MAG TPA: hypothetical protein VEQ42_14025 [Pyrinomonadaceae bacterium]|nr:hypothetical protein [Pyrinomonadaceae bacterium]